jgi:general secretion pathway protein I
MKVFEHTRAPLAAAEHRGRIRRHPPAPEPGGFTLIEVMVALAIVALGMMAVNTQLNRYAVGAAYLEQKTLASWVAGNIIAELSLAPEWPAIGDREEELDFGPFRWHSRIDVSETPVDNLRRIDVYVSLAEDPDRVVHTMTSLVEPPPPRGIARVRWVPPVLETGP